MLKLRQGEIVMNMERGHRLTEGNLGIDPGLECGGYGEDPD